MRAGCRTFSARKGWTNSASMPRSAPARYSYPVAAGRISASTASTLPARRHPRSSTRKDSASSRKLNATLNFIGEKDGATRTSGAICVIQPHSTTTATASTITAVPRITRAARLSLLSE